MAIHFHHYKHKSMKKPGKALPAGTLHAVFAVKKTRLVKKHTDVVAHPDEETITRLNALAKQSPFCYYYRVKEHDVL
jgi:hypothetical protein